MVLVSVIMSVYNTPLEYLREAVASILKQTYKNLEFVIVDDGSSDNDVIDYLNKLPTLDNRVKLIKNITNIGLTKSLNIAIENSHGKYLARMDADDISLPNRIEEQVKYMEDNPQICQTGTAILIVSKDGIILDTSKQKDHLSNQKVCDIRLLFENTGYAHSSFMLRKSFLDEYGIRYREDIKKAQDYALTTDCILAGGKRHLINEPLLKYRVHEGQITSSSYSEQVECQAITAHRRLYATFESLNDEECWAIARLNHERQDYSSKVHIDAIRKIIEENNKKQLFDAKMLKEEFYYEWYRKIMRISRINGKPWGMFHLFNFRVVPTVVKIKYENYLANKSR